ncbi:tRNA-splicing endonuclease subunit Sen54-like [Tubulanus polymorphus]|uniref:tRNA-splicing endonuclease subunit Sen54-like n=1 Tax=Tubulanus polymorphus TaxID=672921 RepID=UPI003DA5876C
MDDNDVEDVPKVPTSELAASKISDGNSEKSKTEETNAADDVDAKKTSTVLPPSSTTRPGGDAPDTNLLSASELHRYRRKIDTELPMRGVKEFLPDHSWLQNKRLDKINETRLSLLKEERVESSRNLVRGIWIPSKDVVRLIHGKGNFWRYVGYSEHGVDYLCPEEALFMVDLGMLEIEYEGLPMSLQTAYTCLLQNVSLAEYQVYAHLSRLGFIVIPHRNQKKLEITEYEEKINLDQILQQKHKKPSKRKRSRSLNSVTDNEDTQKSKKLSEERIPTDSTETAVQIENESLECEIKTEPILRDTCDIVSVHAAAQLSKEWANRLPHSNWNNIEIPNILDYEGDTIHPEIVKEISHDSSSFPYSRDWLPADTCGFSFPRKILTSSRNWTEYKQELVMKSENDAELTESPVGILWDGDVTPLLKPWEATSTAAVLEKLQVVKRAEDIPTSTSDSVKFSYDVYPADEKGNFRKSEPGLPHYRIIVHLSANDPPNLSVLNCCLKDKVDSIKLVWAVVDYGNISFYSYSEFCLPIDIIK